MDENTQQSSAPSQPRPYQDRHFRVRLNKKKLTLIGIVMLMAVAIPATIFLAQQQQDNRQQAAGGACALKPVDVILVIDTSNSMQGTNLSLAKSGATQFINTVLPAGKTANRIGIATFDNNGGLNRAPTSDKQALLATIQGLNTPGKGDGGTCLECALDKVSGADVLSGFAGMAPRPENEKHVVILTDGKINRYQKPDGTIAGSTNSKDEAKARDQAASAINRIVSANSGVSVSTMQYGGTTNQAWLTQSIVKGKGTYEPQSGSSTAIDAMFNKIATRITGGTIIGYVFNDLNKNGTPETGEAPFPGVTVKLNDGRADTDQLTNSEGKAIFSGACPGTTYKLTVLAPIGYEGSPDAFSSLVKNGITVTENQTVTHNFGLKKQENATSLICDPTDITVSASGDVQTVKATLKDKDGKPLANKTIIWNTDNNNIVLLTPTPGPVTPTAASVPAVPASPQL